ncbi:hypothetical protein [Rhizobium sp. WSM1325]|uniref:Uncharacterized protein n=1 Tax=Rhizobium leguminosarum bv. trifolii (strain WSM1325) TaxID=395491 RepID=C6ARC6_RHILS|nr:hypothetical protein [Rhizobium leguminosarum]ACS55076.1 hypothetical protein Rleg_0776 [Rhizobium leguminosarum bv. trifolii WSM1325]
MTFIGKQDLLDSANASRREQAEFHLRYMIFASTLKLSAAMKIPAFGDLSNIRR